MVRMRSPVQIWVAAPKRSTCSAGASFFVSRAFSGARRKCTPTAPRLCPRRAACTARKRRPAARGPGPVRLCFGHKTERLENFGFQGFLFCACLPFKRGRICSGAPGRNRSLLPGALFFSRGTWYDTAQKRGRGGGRASIFRPCREHGPPPDGTGGKNIDLRLNSSKKGSQKAGGCAIFLLTPDTAALCGTR